MGIVSFVILHYKDQETTDLCVRSILRMEQQDRIRIVIVDNDIYEIFERRNSLLRKYQAYDNITVLQIKENGGFSYANNQGYKYARERQNASFVLVLNNDIEFIQKDFLKKLDESYCNHFCHVLGPDIIRRATGEHQNPMAQRIRTKKEAKRTVMLNRRALKYYSLLYPFLYLNSRREEKKQLHIKKGRKMYYQSAQQNIVPFGACLIFTPKFVTTEEVAFWPETKFYYEEYLLTYRCKKKGYIIIYDPELKVIHESGMATKKNFENEKKRLRFTMERIAEASEIYYSFIGDK